MRQDDLASTVKVSKQFAVDVERGRPTVQFDRVLLLLKELGITLSVDIEDEALKKLEQIQTQRHDKASLVPPLVTTDAQTADDDEMGTCS